MTMLGETPYDAMVLARSVGYYNQRNLTKVVKTASLQRKRT